MKFGSKLAASATFVVDPRVNMVISPRSYNCLDYQFYYAVFENLPGNFFTKSIIAAAACLDLSTFMLIFFLNETSPSPSFPKPWVSL